MAIHAPFATIPYMRKAQRYLLFILILLGIYLIYTYFPVFFHHLPPISPSNTNLILYEEPTDGRDPILQSINNAQKQILLEVYLLSDKQIISALLNAKQRGVDVRVMLEEHPFGSGNLNQQTAQTLEKNNISFEWTSSAFSLTHEKGMVIDGQKAFILTQNLTASAFDNNREYDIVDTNPDDITEEQQIFVSDWERKWYTPDRSTHLIVSPLNSRAVLTALINSAQTTLDIETEEIEDPQIIHLLITKAHTVKESIIIPTFSQLSANKQTADELTRAGATVKTISSPYIHAKLIIVDNKESYIGSINLSTQSMDNNRELGILITQSDVLTRLSDSFQNDFTRAALLP